MTVMKLETPFRTIVNRTICFLRPALPHICRLFLYAGILALSLSGSAADGPAVPAFPGAEGYGKYSVGGRGGKVYEVTILESSGPGSLGEAIGASEPRTVVFRVSGTIEGNFNIKNDKITIAGQTAPGDGICINVSLVNVENLATTEFVPQLAVVFDIRCRSTNGNGKSLNVS